MIKREIITLRGQKFVKIYSSKDVYLKDKNDFLYPVIYDLEDNDQEYFETNILIK